MKAPPSAINTTIWDALTERESWSRTSPSIVDVAMVINAPMPGTRLAGQSIHGMPPRSDCPWNIPA